MVAHASAKSYPAEAAKTAGWTAARAERTKRTWFRKDVPDHDAFRFVLFAVETSGYMGREAVKFVNRLGDIAAESGNIPKGSYKRVKGRSHTVEKRKASHKSQKRKATHKNPMQPASHRDSHTHPHSAQTQHTTSS